MKCEECNREFKVGQDRFRYGNRTVCEACLTKLARMGNMCPSCGTHIPEGKDEVGLVLPLSKTSKVFQGLQGQTALEPEALVIVCPGCHVLFLDTFHYETLRGLVPQDS